MSVVYSYFPHDHKHRLGSDGTWLASGDIYVHNADSRGGIDSCPCVFLSERGIITPVYKGPHALTVLDRMREWLSIANLDNCSILLLIKSVNWHTDPEAHHNPAICAGMADSMAGRVSPADFSSYVHAEKGASHEIQLQ